MEIVRKIAKAWQSKATVEGAGVHLKRAFGYHQVPQLDPFLLLNGGTVVRVICGEVNSVRGPARFLLVPGRPVGEPAAWYGPVVMNTEDELRVAFEEYQNGTFTRNG
ncbi:pirin-like C-terminal cupin domain-containing protein [Geobacter pickeringii]|uniref:Pirin C-terminal domain-containing protein n=1 Tax=Geobacter pickeringii TaxID=345632 RepID=A0A0B5BC23_9BACT|nr:pirin-like C-terminal cupin domain-containing protein [Geobacter pickeringii]AJE02579.1 hypothetical protein GPICK_03585 [Geobacter pickeringii]